MRVSLLSFMAAAFCTLANGPSTSAQVHEIPQLNSCIKEFYDPEMYNWLTFRNTCAQALTIVLQVHRITCREGRVVTRDHDLHRAGSDALRTDMHDIRSKRDTQCGHGCSEQKQHCQNLPPAVFHQSRQRYGKSNQARATVITSSSSRPPK